MPSLQHNEFQTVRLSAARLHQSLKPLLPRPRHDSHMPSSSLRSAPNCALAAPQFLKQAPIAASHAPSSLRLALGLPTAAYCCWNGAAVLNAAPFLPPPPPPPPPPSSPTPGAASAATTGDELATSSDSDDDEGAGGSDDVAAADARGLPQFSAGGSTGDAAPVGEGSGGGEAGGPEKRRLREEMPAASRTRGGSYPQLRFRRGLPGECDASECSLLCDDLHRLGYGKVVIDPSVRLTYLPYHDVGLHSEWYFGAPMVPWEHLVAPSAGPGQPGGSANRRSRAQVSAVHLI
jgi:hypothetical protein